jgi:hypothetical protein
MDFKNSTNPLLNIIVHGHKQKREYGNTRPWDEPDG